MPTPVNPTVPPQDEGRLREQILDTLLLTLSIIGLPAFALAQWRALDLGSGLREAVQLVMYASLLWATVARHRISLRFKANFLILVFLSIGVVGQLSLGVFAGGVFFLPIPLFIAALFHGIRTTAVLGLMIICIQLTSAAGFTAFGWNLPASADALLRNPLNWGVYVLCFTVMMTFIGTSIRHYRNMVELLLGELRTHRDTLLQRNSALEHALAEIRTLRGIIPICSWCHKIRDDAGAWKQLESYISAHSEAQFSHGICPHCVTKAETGLSHEA